MTPIKQQRKVQQRHKTQYQNKTRQHSSINASYSTRVLENYDIDLIELLDSDDEHDVEADFQDTFLDPQTIRTEDYNNYYSKELLDTLLIEKIDLSNFLIYHQIKPYVRSTMVRKMSNLFDTQEQKLKNDNSFFRAVSLMDLFLKKSQKTYKNQDLDLIGATCVFIASKIEDLKCFRINDIHQHFTYNKFTTFDILKFEQLVLETLSYDTNFPIVNHYLQYLIYQCFGQSQNNFTQYIHDVTNYILKQICYSDHKLIQQNQILLATSILGYTIQLYIINYKDKLINNRKVYLVEIQMKLPEIGDFNKVEYLNSINILEKQIRNNSE